MLTGIITASGAATRFNGLPKFLLPIQNSSLSLLDIHIKNALQICDQIVLTINSRWVPLLPTLDSRVHIIPLEPSTMPDAVLVAANLIPSDHYVVIMPDTYIDVSPIERLVEVEASSGSDIVVASWKMTKSLVGRVGQIISEGNQITNIVDKDSTCNLPRFWGMILLNKPALQFIHNTDDHLGQALARAIHSGTIMVEARIPGKYYDVCDLASYTELLIGMQSSRPQ